MSGNPEQFIAETVMKKVGALAAGTVATAIAAHTVRNDNVNQQMSSVYFGADLGKTADKSGNYEAGIGSLNSINADATAYDAFSHEAGLQPGVLEATQKTDLLSSAGRAVLGKEALEVKCNTTVLRGLQSQKRAKISRLDQPSQQEAVTLSGVDALPGEALGSEEKQDSTASTLISPSPTPSRGRGTKRPRFASISCSSPFGGAGKKTSEYSQQVTPGPTNVEVYSTPASGVIVQLVLIVSVGVLVYLGTLSFLSGLSGKVKN